MARLSSQTHNTIVGPVLPHLMSIGMDGKKLTIATAFYSNRALSAIGPSAESVTVLCRLDLGSTDEWIQGFVAPDSLLTFLRSQEQRGAEVSLFVSATAHAKVYAGSRAVLIGSANLTMQGFGGGHEIVCRIQDLLVRKQADRALRDYSRLLKKTELDELEKYVLANRRDVLRKRSKLQKNDRLPRAERSDRRHLGTYEAFLKWLQQHKSQGAAEVHARAFGKSNLSGHIDRNFHGLRQFLLVFPETLQSFRRTDPDSYKLSKDPAMEDMLKSFVHDFAVDEASFVLERWRTYLPIECGGRAGRHGGTIGNLNYMLPLVAAYLAHTLKVPLEQGGSSPKAVR